MFPNMEGKSQVKNTCCECQKSFSSFSNLKKHLKRFHPANESLVSGENKNYKYKCDQCSNNFNRVAHLRYHQRKKHKITPPPSIKQTCPLCFYLTSGEKNDILLHFKSVHYLDIITHDLEFSTYELFMNWKDFVETETKSKFVKSNENGNRTYYKCHRSGYFISQGKGLRKLKSQGSNKINGYCPANIISIKAENNVYKVKYSDTHVGHENDVDHLYLTYKERSDLACKISSKVPFKTILDEVRGCKADPPLQRRHLLKRKDLYNIERSFNLTSSSVRCNSQKNEVLNIEDYVNIIGPSGSSSVLFYKAQGAINLKYLEFRKEDVVLALMNDQQMEILKSHGTVCICLDGVHELNKHGLKLINLLVIDQITQGFPCAFLLSNRIDDFVLTLFFDAISGKVGKLATRVLMTDVGNSFLDSWSQIMDSPLSRLYCPWHVEQEWKKNLEKIIVKDKQEKTHEKLRKLMKEENLTSFTLMIAEAIKEMTEDPETSDFGDYFVRNFSKNFNSWAYCHGGFLYAHPGHEQSHDSLYRVFTKIKSGKSIEKIVDSLFKHVRENFESYENNRTAALIKEIGMEHLKAKSALNKIVKLDNGWEVHSVISPGFYFVQEQLSNCKCQIVCEYCHACNHRFSCTCGENGGRLNICKHIHLVGEYEAPKDRIQKLDRSSLLKLEDPLRENDPDCEGEEDITLFIDSDKEDGGVGVNVDETGTQLENIGLTSEEELISTETISLAQRKESLTNKLLEIVNYVQNADSVEVIEGLEGLLLPLNWPS